MATNNSGGFNPADRIQQLQQQGYTGHVVQNGQIVQMNNGVIAQPQQNAAQDAAAAPAAISGTTQSQGQGQGVLGGTPGASPLGNWASWMYSGGVSPGQWANTGGVDPSSWMGLGGSPDLSFLSQYGGMVQNPTTVSAPDANSLYNAGQSYSDAAYDQATRQLDPQWQQAQQQFDQQMVNQGLAPGSAAYQTAYNNFQNSKNDAYSQARDQSMQQGLAAQAQGFGQGLSQSQLSNQLAQALIGANTSVANQQLGGNANIMGSLLGGNQSLMQALLGGNSNIAQQLIGGQATQNAANASAGASRYATSMNHDIQQQNLDNGLMMQLFGLGNGVTQYNNGLIGQDQSRNMSFFPYMPSGGGGGQIDVQSPYNNQYNGQMNSWNYQNQQADAQNQMYANMAMAFMMCSREYKETVGEITPKKALEAIKLLPVDRWRYKHEKVAHIGTYAEDFNRVLGLEPKPVISVIDALGVLMGSVKEIASRLDRIEARLPEAA